MIKKNWKMIIIIVISIIISTTAGAFAAGTLTASQVTYNRGGVSMELDDALDDLYSKVPFTVGELVKINGDTTDDKFYVLHVGKETCEIITRYNLTKTNFPTTQTNASYEYTAYKFTSSNDIFWSERGLNLNLERGYSVDSALGSARWYAKAKGAISGRLLTFAEASSLKTIADANTSGQVYKMLWGTENAGGCLRYWLGTSGSDNSTRVWCVRGYQKDLYYYSCSDAEYNGVRPVLTVLKSQLSASS